MDHSFEKILTYLKKLPALSTGGHGTFEDGNWWIKFGIDTNHPLAWRHVQELGYVLNYISLEDRLPTIFMPVSPPPYMNGGVEQCLGWVIESKDPTFTPDICVEWLEGRLPDPVEDVEMWNLENDEEES
jgi:hypothetical protein